MASSNDTPIFRLPNELLFKIFNYISRIPTKIKLERVCGRFRFISLQPKSWKGVHKLEFVMKCHRTKHALEFLSLFSNCGGGVALNRIDADFAKWPLIVKSLLQRTKIRQLLVHCGSDLGLLQLNPGVFRRIFELFTEFKGKIELEIVEFHLPSLNRDNVVPVVEQIKPLFMEALQLSIPFLKRFAFYCNDVDLHDMEDEQTSLFPIWPIIQKCNYLNIICYNFDNYVMNFDAIVGKPLTTVMYDHCHNSSAIGGLANVLNSAKGEGVRFMYFDNDGDDQDFDLIDFAEHFTDKAREKLECLKIGDYNIEMNGIFRQLFMVPSLFPNLETLDIFTEVDVEDIAQCCSYIGHFFDVAQNASSPIEILLNLSRNHTEEQVKFELTKLCERSQICVEFGSEDFPPWVFMAKGNATVSIDKNWFVFRFQ